MALSQKRWLIVCAVAVFFFAGTWIFCQSVLHMAGDDSSAIAGAVIAILALPLGAWASNVPPAQHFPQTLDRPLPRVRLPDADPVETYLELVRQRFRYVDTEVLTPLAQQTADYPPVPLTDVFVQQDTRADPPSVELPRELLLRLIEDGPPPERELPLGVDHDALLEVRAAYDQAPKVPVLSLIAGEQATRIVLLGDPGAGKSTLGRYVVYSLAHDEVSGALAPLAGWLPVFVELREFAQHSSESFLDFLDHLYHADDLGLPKDFLEPFLLADGKALVIFDGLDEIFDLGLRRRTVNKIVHFATNHPNARVLVTSRPIDFRRSILESAGFRRHRLQDHDHEKIKIFIRNWYQIAYPNDPSRAARLAERLIGAVETSGSVRELAGNPLLLTILAIIGRRQRLPRDRKTVYEHAVTVLVDRWDPSRFLHDRGEAEVPYLDAADKLEMLRLVARRMQDSPAGLSGNFISGGELVGEIATYLLQRDATGLTADQARAAARVMLRQFRERNFVLSRFGSEVYGFVHRCFLEYLAAADIEHRFTSERTLSEPELIGEVFGRRWREPAWHEVLILVCGMLDHKFASKAVLALFEADPHWMASETAEPQQIFLAIRCLAESRHIGRQVGACQIAVEKLIHVLGVAHRRITRSHSEDLNLAVEQTLLPIFTSFGPNWPGRERFLAWYTGAGSADIDDPGTMAIATKLALALLGPENGLYTFLCASASTSSRPALRQAAVWALPHSWAEDGHGMALVRRAATADPNKEVRQTAMKAVAAARPDDPETLLLLCRTARLDPHEDLRHAAVEAITRDWGAHPDTADLLREIAVGDRHADVRQAAIKGFAEVEPLSRATVDLLNQLAAHADHDDVRLAALSALLPVHRQGFEDLTRLAQAEANEDIRRLVVSAVAEEHAHHPGTLPWLMRKAADDPAPGVRQTAAQAIAGGWADDAGARGFLLDRLTADGSDAVRESVVKAMGAEHFVLSEALQRLRRCAESDVDTGVRQAATRAIALYRRQDPATLPWLRMRAADDPQQLVRQVALREVARGWPDVPDIPVWLRRRATGDGFDSVRRAAVQMIATIGADDPQTRQWLEESATNDLSWEVRQTALRAMADGWPAEPENLARLRICVRTDRNEQVRHTALRLIVAHWRDEPETWPLLREIATADGNELLRRSAVTVMADGWPSAETMAVLLRCAEDRMPTVRRACLRALAAGWPADQQILRLLRSLVASDPNEYVRLTAVQELARRWHHDPETTALLYERAGQDGHQAVRHVILQAVATGWHSQPQALLVVRQLAETDQHPTIRGEALQFLAEYWPGESGTAALLRDRAENDQDERVREMASRAIVTQQMNSRASL